MKNLFYVLLMSLMLSACGGGSEDNPTETGYFWDGFIDHTSDHWHCRDASNGQFVPKFYCADQKVNDLKWPTKGITAITNLWYKGVSIQEVCKSEINSYIIRGGHYKVFYDDNFIDSTLRNLGENLYIDINQYWNQSDRAAWSMTVYFNDNNWAIFAIGAPNQYSYHNAKCRVFMKENGHFKGLIPQNI